MAEEVVRPETEHELGRTLIETGMYDFSAREFAVKAFGTYRGGCFGIDEVGREWSLRELEEQGKLKKAS